MSADIWRGLKTEAQTRVHTKSYTPPTLLEQVRTTGIEFGHLSALDFTKSEVADVWIAGVEPIPHKVYPQRHRGIFGELGRMGEGVFGRIQMWPRQWATARMDAGSCKGFHLHPPYLEPGIDPVAHFAHLFAGNSPNYHLRQYDKEQWDAMFFVQGKAEIILVDERAGLPRKIMRFFIDGDNHRSANNGGLVIPPGVAHALRAEGSEDLIMVYGTSTTFAAENEGRIVSGIELAPLPVDWEGYLFGPG